MENVEKESAQRSLLKEAALALQSDCIDSSSFLVAVKQCLDSGNAPELQELFLSEAFKDVIAFTGWEVIGIIIPYLNYIPVDRVYQDILQIIFETGNAKEILLAYSEHLDAVSSIISLQTCLMFLKKAIMKIGKRRIKFLQMTCAELSVQFIRLSKGTFLECSITSQQEDSDILNSEFLNKELLATPNADRLDNSVDDSALHEYCALHHDDAQNSDCVVDELVNKRCCCLVDAALMFIKPFIIELKVGSCTEHRANTNWSIIGIFFKFLYGLLIFPLGCYPVSSFENKCSRCFHCLQDSNVAAKFVIETLFSLRIPFVTLMEKSCEVDLLDESDIDRGECFESAGKAMAIYLILVKEIGLTYIPFVLSPRMLFQLTFWPAMDLLRSHVKVAEARKNALELIENIMCRMEELSITSEILTSIQALKLYENLMEILSFEGSKEIRVRCYELFTFSLKRFEVAARLEILRQLASQGTHPGAISLIIQCTKNEVVNIEKEANSKSKGHLDGYIFEIFCFSMDFVRMESCAILLNSDRIIAALNFLRFLLLRSAVNNDRFRILSRFLHIEDAYISELQRLVDKTYSLHLGLLSRSIEENCGSAKQVDQHYNVADTGETDSFTSLGDLNIQEIRLALNTLDIIRSISARISEIYKNTTQLH